jgi:DNA-binding NarL/FixJ family response regulator
MGVSVLIVDDDADFRRLAVRLLRAAGLTIAGEAATVGAAVDAASVLRPDAVLLDVGLPDGDGRALAPQLTALSWHPRVVLTSSDPDAVSDGDLERAGAAGFLPKQDLPNGVARLLSGRG